jgi:hypothetical protein
MIGGDGGTCKWRKTEKCPHAGTDTKMETQKNLVVVVV